MSVENILNRLERLGIDRPKAMSVQVLELDSAYLAPWQTIIGLAIPYALQPKTACSDRQQISQVSIMAWEWDYHHTIKETLQGVLGDGEAYAIHIDSGPLPERQIAMKMGLATASRSQLLIHPSYGTAFHLAFILTNQPVTDEETPSAYRVAACCSDCNRCQKACPGGALTGTADFDSNRCVSAITQKKGVLTDWESALIGCHLYGCDICQLVCPANAHVVGLERAAESFPVFRETANRLNPETLLGLTQKDFAKRYGHAGFAWRGVKTMKRNALINMGNHQSQTWQSVLEASLQNPVIAADEVLSQAALWSLNRQLEQEDKAKKNFIRKDRSL